MKSYQGHFVGNTFIPLDNETIPENMLTAVTVLDEPIEVYLKNKQERQDAAWEKFLAALEDCKDEEMPDFEPVKFREIAV